MTEKPSSAKDCSKSGSSFAHYWDTRLFSRRTSFSATASWIALLRFWKYFNLAGISICLSILSSIVIAIFDAAIFITSGMTLFQTSPVFKPNFSNVNAALFQNKIYSRGSEFVSAFQQSHSSSISMSTVILRTRTALTLSTGSSRQSSSSLAFAAQTPGTLAFVGNCGGATFNDGSSS